MADCCLDQVLPCGTATAGSRLKIVGLFDSMFSRAILLNYAMVTRRDGRSGNNCGVFVPQAINSMLEQEQSQQDGAYYTFPLGGHCDLLTATICGHKLVERSGIIDTSEEMRTASQLTPASPGIWVILFQDSREWMSCSGPGTLNSYCSRAGD